MHPARRQPLAGKSGAQFAVAGGDFIDHDGGTSRRVLESGDALRGCEPLWWLEFDPRARHGRQCGGSGVEQEGDREQRQHRGPEYRLSHGYLAFGNLISIVRMCVGSTRIGRQGDPLAGRRGGGRVAGERTGV